MNAAPSSEWDERTTPLILALTGGGFRGYFTALVLARIEEQLAAPCHKVFNLIAGTSIGGIIALGLAFGISAQEIATTIGDFGNKIFPDSRFKKLRRLLGPTYTAGPITDSLHRLLGDKVNRPIAEALSNVMVVTVSPGAGKMEVLASWDEHRTAAVTVKDAALATSAAPTYFKAHRLKSGIPDLDLLDGGIAANAPDAVAIQRAVTELGWPESQIAVLSVGTCASIEGAAASLRPSAVGYIGALYKLGGRGVVNLLMAVQEDRGIGEAVARLGTERHLRIDRSPSDQQAKFLALDNASQRAHDTLKQLADIAATNILKDHNVWNLVLSRALTLKG